MTSSSNREKTFKDFIFKQLKLASLAPHTYETIYEMGYEYFVEAFTHESFRPENFKDIHEFRSQTYTNEELFQITSLDELAKYKDYNMLEFLGDKQLNACIAELLLSKFPTMKSNHLTFSFQRLSSDEYLAKYAEDRGFFPHILMSPFYYQQVLLWKNGKTDQLDSKLYKNGDAPNIYIKVLEDVCESFSAALVKAVDKYSGIQFGPGMSILKNWASDLEGLIDFDPFNVKAIEMVMKELWEDVYAKDCLTGKKFTNHNMFKIGDDKRPGHVPVEAIDPVTRKVVAKTIGYSEQNARKKAAPLVVEYLHTYRESEIVAGKEYKQAFKNANANNSTGRENLSSGRGRGGQGRGGRGRGNFSR